MCLYRRSLSICVPFCEVVLKSISEREGERLYYILVQVRPASAPAPYSRTVLAKVTTRTVAAPPSLSTFEHSATVEPVV